MSKLSNFLHLKIYRRTFLLYLSIVLIFVTAMLVVFYHNMQSNGMEAYLQVSDTAFTQAERQLNSVTNAIDNFFTHLYASPSLLNDFFHFFGATPAEYAESQLNSAGLLYETYLASCNNLISDTDYCIRYIIYYSTSNIISMEYSASGYSRYQIIDLDAAEALCQRGFLYTKDIHQGSSYVGKVSFVIDVTGPVYQAFCTQPDTTVFLLVHDTVTTLGNPSHADADWERILNTGSKQGHIALPGSHSDNLLYTVQSSDQFSYSVISLCPAKIYTVDQLHELILLSLGLIFVFTLITILYVRQFSNDSLFIQSILHSLIEAQSSNFVPVKIGPRKDEFATIATLERIRLRALSEGCPAVAEATADLGLLYRNIVKTEPIITLEKELQITKQYLDLMCFLYHDQLLYHCDIPDDISAISTPKIWMQPIVENFFKHNFQNDDKLKVIVISGRRRSDGILFQFFYNIGHISDEQIVILNQQFTPEKIEASRETASGIGLQNVYDRLYLYYGNRVEMRIQNHAPSGVCIQILLKDEVTN